MFWKWKNKTVKEDELLILFGTRSGNSKLVAKQAKQFYRKNGVKASCLNMAKFSPAKLTDVNKLLAVVSTHGEGEPPEPAQKFFINLMGNSIGDLSRLRYSICALGDSGYEQFCKAGKDLDERLSELGAKPVLPRVDCDVEFSNDAANWIKESFNVIVSKNGHAKTHDKTLEVADAVNNRANISAIVTEKKQLTADSAQSPVFHVSLDVSDPDFLYEAGDSIEILPKNPEWVADKILNQQQLSPNETNYETGSSLKEFLLNEAEITRLNAGAVKRYQQVANHEKLAQLLQNKSAFSDYLKQANLLDLLLDFPCRLTAEQLFFIPVKLSPRIYSIASGPQLNPGKMDLTVKTVRYQFKNLPHEGSGSVYINEYLQTGTNIEFSLEKNPEFRLPEDSKTPIIMIGVGTGIAPFRAFLQERKAQSIQKGTWLIWGAKKQTCDSLYKTELEAFKKDNTLERLDNAFSKDNPPKKYVQDILTGNKDTLLEWLENGAHIYVCGSIAMGQGVKKCLDNLFENTPVKSVENLQALNRFHTDIY